MDFKDIETTGITQGPLYQLFDLTEQEADSLLAKLEGKNLHDAINGVAGASETANEAAFLLTYIGTQLSA